MRVCAHVCVRASARVCVCLCVRERVGGDVCACVPVRRAGVGVLNKRLYNTMPRAFLLGRKYIDENVTSRGRENRFGFSFFSPDVLAQMYGYYIKDGFIGAEINL